MLKKNKKKPQKKRSKFLFTWPLRSSFGVKRKLNLKPSMRIFYRKTFSNIFITLTDLRNKVVYSLSAGMCAEKNNKRSKTAPYIIEIMAGKIIKILQRFRIRRLEIIIKSFVRIHMRILVNKLMQSNYKIISVLDKRVAAHNGVRGKALKRR